VVLIVIVVIASQGGSSGGKGGKSGASGNSGSTPALALSMTAAHSVPVPGTPPSIPWTQTGQSAIAVPSAGLLETSGPEESVPIASLTKMMTAFLTLEQHPLTATAAGPKLTMTSVDQSGFEQDTVSDASSVEVQTGEVLTERQLLSALIVRSANNIADTLARWNAGSVTAFVARMNAEAQALGMSSTHYVDTNGLDAGSVSTAHDQLVLAQRALELPSFAAIVNQTTVTLPYVGTLHNYVGAVGSNGVVGVKSGFTNAAESCVVLAAIREVGGKQVVVLAADLTQPLSLEYAGQEDVTMINAVAPGLRLVTIAGARQVVGKLSQPAGTGGRSTGLWVAVETSAPLVAVAWPGSQVVLSLVKGKAARSVSSGAAVGFLEASAAGGTPVSVPLVAASSLAS
jgi:D-alanyl-D-alanine carboxypeptidase (penicillin-binding protein 5/6)